MTAAEAKARAHEAIQTHLRASVEASEARLLEAVSAGDIGVDQAAETSAAIHAGMVGALRQACLESDRAIDALIAEESRRRE